MEQGLSVVIPVYNSAEILPLLLQRLSATLPLCASFYEVILVNDGSRDNSWDIICELSPHYPWMKGINLMRNYGQHNAILCGINAASYNITITMDDDLQHPPEEIPRLIQELEKNYDAVYGVPEKRQHASWRNLTSKIIYFALRNAMGVENAMNISAFRIFKTDLRKAFAHYNGSYVSIDILLTWGTTKFSNIVVKHDARAMGVSNYNFRKLLLHSLNMITSFSAVPLQVASMLGFLFTLLGIALFLYIVGKYLLYGGSVPGFSFLASSIAVFSGIQLFVLGIIGEYIARIHFRTMSCPYGVVRDTISCNQKSDSL